MAEFLVTLIGGVVIGFTLRWWLSVRHIRIASARLEAIDWPQWEGYAAGVPGIRQTRRRNTRRRLAGAPNIVEIEKVEIQESMSGRSLVVELITPAGRRWWLCTDAKIQERERSVVIFGGPGENRPLPNPWPKEKHYVASGKVRSVEEVGLYP